MNTIREQISVDGNPMNLFSACPDGNGPLPAVVVIQHQYGVDKFMEEMTERFARDGYFAICPDLYHRDGPDCQDDGPTRRGRARDSNIINDVNATMAHLRGNKLVDSKRVAILGFCMGGRVSYLAACEVPAIRAAVPFYGGGIAGQQFAPGAAAPVSLTAKMRAAIQLHFGENDSYIPPSAVEEIRQALVREKKDHEIHVYKGAGHGFFCRERAAYNEEAAKLAWERTKGFFKKQLQG